MFKNLMPVLAGLLFCVFAQAERIPLIRVTAEAFPGEEYFMGMEVDEGQNVKGLFYHDPFQKSLTEQVRNYSLAEAKVGVVLLQKQKYKLIVLSAEKIDSDEYVLNLTYLVNAITSKHRDVEFRVKKNAATGRFDVTSTEEAGRSLTEAFVETNTLFGKQVGIKRIKLL